MLVSVLPVSKRRIVAGAELKLFASATRISVMAVSLTKIVKRADLANETKAVG
jgi:hypothetical protein